MASISAICAERSAPIARPVVSFDGVAWTDATEAPAGEGVAGMAVFAVPEECAGAAGGAGVATVAGAGVDGALGADDEAAGAALGYREC